MSTSDSSLPRAISQAEVDAGIKWLHDVNIPYVWHLWPNSRYSVIQIMWLERRQQSCRVLYCGRKPPFRRLPHDNRARADQKAVPLWVWCRRSRTQVSSTHTVPLSHQVTCLFRIQDGECRRVHASCPSLPSPSPGTPWSNSCRYGRGLSFPQWYRINLKVFCSLV